MSGLGEIYKFLLTSPWVSRGVLAAGCFAGIYVSWWLIKLVTRETVKSIKEEYGKRMSQLDQLSLIVPQVNTLTTLSPTLAAQVKKGVENHLEHMEADTREIKMSNMTVAQTLVRMETKADERHGEMIRVLTDIRDEFRSKPPRSRAANGSTRFRAAKKK